MNESTPKSPNVKNAFHFVTYMNNFAMNTASGIDVLLDIDTDFWQSESVTWDCSRNEGFSEWTHEYCKYVVAIENYLQENKPSKKSWVDLLTETNVHIVGLGLAFEEIDLWYLLTRRMRRIKRGDEINNEIFFYQIKDKCNDAVIQMLEVTGVKVILIDLPKIDGKEDWNKAYQDIYKNIKRIMNDPSL